MGTPAGAKKAREARALKRHMRAEREDRPDIATFVTDPRYLGRSIGARLSVAQRTLLKGCYGQPLTDEELEVWQEATRRDYPALEFLEVTVVAGSRAGKDSRFLAPVLLYEAIYGGFVVNVGETAVVACVAQDMKAAGIVHRLMRGYLKESPLLSEELVSERRDALVLRNGIEVRVFPCTSKAIYGYSVPAGGMDELGRFKFEGAADSDVDIQASILRGQGNYRRAKLFKVSTPSGRDGVLYQDFQQSYGQDDPDRLVWQLSSERMNPAGVDPAFLVRMRTRLDPMRYARLFEAEFSEDVGVFLPGHLVEAAVQTGVTMRPPESGRKYVAAVDASEGGDDAFALAIAFADGEQIVQVYSQAWTKPKTKTMDLSATVQGIAATLTRYGVKRVHGDRLTGQWIVEAFKRHGVEYVHPKIRRQGASDYVTRSRAYLEAGPLFRTGAVKILDDPDVPGTPQP